MTKVYPSNLTWEQWELITQEFPQAKPGGRKRTVISKVVTLVNYLKL